MENAAAACNIAAHSWAEANNAKVLKEFEASGTELRTLPIDVVKALKKEMGPIYDDLASKDPMFKKVMDNYFAFKKEHDIWANASEKIWHGELRGI